LAKAKKIAAAKAKAKTAKAGAQAGTKALKKVQTPKPKKLAQVVESGAVRKELARPVGEGEVGSAVISQN
jgi:hypothetical protein